MRFSLVAAASRGRRSCSLSISVVQKHWLASLLDARTKELLGLVASAVLRCNDCIDYHLEQCVKAGFTRDELVDAMNVALVVGGSIVIPHARHAFLSMDELYAEKDAGTLPA